MNCFIINDSIKTNIKRSGYLFLIWFGLGLTFSSCSKDDTEAKIVSNHKEISQQESGETLLESYRYEGLLYPAGTSINENTENRLEITLPDNFLFMVNDGNSIRYIGKVCHECECTRKAHSEGSSNGCDPAYGQGGFYCDHETDFCIECVSRKVDCATSMRVEVIGIIDVQAGVQYIKSKGESLTLSQFQFNEQSEIDLFNDNFLLTDRQIKELLFTESYWAASNAEDEVIFINAFGNLFGIRVKSNWKSFTSLVISDFYSQTVNSDHIKCNCSKERNPGVEEEAENTCTVNVYGIKCMNKCTKGCTMTIE